MDEIKRQIEATAKLLQNARFMPINPDALITFILANQLAMMRFLVRDPTKEENDEGQEPSKPNYTDKKESM